MALSLCCSAFPLLSLSFFPFAQSAPISAHFKGGTTPLKKQEKSPKKKKNKAKKKPRLQLLKTTEEKAQKMTKIHP